MRNADPKASGTILVLTVAAAVAPITFDGQYTDGVAALALALLLPGLSVVHAMTGSRSLNLQSVVFAVGLSVAITIVGGVTLNAMGELSRLGWSLFLCTVVAGATLVNLFTEAVGEQFADRVGMPTIKPAQVGMCIAAVLFASGAAVLARSGAASQQEYAFTEFWMVPKGEVDSNMITVGIRNVEKEDTTYDVALFADGANILRKSRITLQPGKSWLSDIPVNLQSRHASKIQAWLFKSDAPYDVYRKVWLSLPHESFTPLKDQG